MNNRLLDIKSEYSGSVMLPVVWIAEMMVEKSDTKNNATANVLLRLLLCFILNPPNFI